MPPTFLPFFQWYTTRPRFMVGAGLSVALDAGAFSVFLPIPAPPLLLWQPDCLMSLAALVWVSCFSQR